MKTKLLITIGIALLISSCDKDNKNYDVRTYSFTGEWVKHPSDFPVSGISNSVSFQIKDAYYIGLGVSDTYVEYYKSFFKFTTEKGWETIKEFPGKTREMATAFVLNGKAYIGLGYNGEPPHQNPYLNDFWVYDPIQDSWDSLRMAFPGEGRRGAIAFTIGEKAYVGTGYSCDRKLGERYFGDFYEFSPTTGWKKMYQLTISPTTRTFTFSIHNEIFLCFNAAEWSLCWDVIKLSKESLSWIKLHSVCIKDYPAFLAPSFFFTLNENGKEQVFVYDKKYGYTYMPEEDTWYEATNLPISNPTATLFVFDNTLYQISGNTTYQFVRKE